MRCFRVLLGLMLATVCVGSLLADEAWNVLPSTEEAPASRLLYRYLEDEARQLLQARQQAVYGLETPEQVVARQVELKQRFIDALGGFPEKTPLNGRVVGSERRDGYRIEKVIYESRPNHHVTGVLYLPLGEGPFPGVLVPCGHSTNGKASEAYQRASILLAKNGMVALCYDPIGQGERHQMLNPEGKPATGGTGEHTLVGIGALLVGKSTATYRIWDGIRSLDYLASRPEVDANRLGCTGNSGGGTLTAYLMALDERIWSAAPSCYITSLERLFATLGPQDAEQNITGQVAFGMDHADYLIMRAPRPTLICVATLDFFDIHGAWSTFREAKRVYGVLGHGERVDLFEYHDKHGFSLPRRQAAMRWMRRWLLDQNDAPTEADFPVATDAEMLCTTSGEVLTEFSGVSVIDLNRAEGEALAAARSAAAADLATVRRLLALPKTIDTAQVSAHGNVEHDAMTVQKLVFQPAHGIPLPALLCTPQQPVAGTAKTVIYLNEQGKAAGMGRTAAIERLVQQGYRVLAVDLRGWGETAPTAGSRSSAGVGQKEFFMGVHLDRPLLGQRVYDLLSVVASLDAQQTGELHLAATGIAGPVALHAAALEPRLAGVTLEGSIVSWHNVVETPVPVNQINSVVPGVLAHYDLPELAAAIAPRRITLRATVDAVGKAVPADVVRKTYAAAPSVVVE